MALSVGQIAPDFTLVTLGAEGPELWKLADQRGKNVLLLFFPMAFTGGCTKEMCEVTASMQEYTDIDAVVAGISGDNPFAQAQWAEKEGIKMTLLSDYEHEVTKAFDVSYDTFIPAKNLVMGGVPKRSAFIVDKEGIIQYVWSDDVPSELPDFAPIKAKLAELG